MAALGPIRLNGTKYGDYWLGVYNGSSFHAAEYNEKRSPQGRVTLYPFAGTPELAGLGFDGIRELWLHQCGARHQRRSGATVGWTCALQ